MVYLIMGSTGAGKTTYARKLARERGGVRFSIDEWIDGLYGADKPKDAGFDWYMERITRAEALILGLCQQLDSTASPAILDLGFTTVEHRKKFWSLFPTFEIHYLDYSAEERWKRVQQRNEGRGDTFVMNVDREMFDFMENRFEPPSTEEQPHVKLHQT